MNTRLDLPIIPPAVLSGVVEIGQREKCDVGSWFAGTGLSATQVFTDSSTKVSFRQAADVLRRAVRALPGRPLGMQVGGRDMLLSMGMLGVALRSCATLSEAIAVGIELHQVSGSLMDLELERFDNSVAIRLRERSPEPELIAFLCEEVLCSTTVLARSVIGPDWSPGRVELTYPPPPYAHQYESFLRCPVEFSATANRIVLPATALGLPLPTHDKPTQAVAIEACRRLLDLGRSGPTITVTVETLLEQNLRQPPTMTDVADRLHVTERTLRRQLADAGESFSAVRDRVRERRATYLLRESGLPVTTVAREVGYSDTREFRRAYIRWTGHSPSAARSRTI
ncbi:putative HTH-type transcriptional regulator [Nocardia cerradoensis]|uniref:Putative HTH-type transcriptional regulator n=1 Tax=Nocardia cerradoensis TaxID=85688 RepID=A0A231GUM0_9NOCA|nr:AraC family transcriptional regulator [Nocardia cerradoensis]OXR40171.1 putative HTH-type transcriptional regulator [Nocardia cerradoensis]